MKNEIIEAEVVTTPAKKRHYEIIDEEPETKVSKYVKHTENKHTSNKTINYEDNRSYTTNNTVNNNLETPKEKIDINWEGLLFIGDIAAMGFKAMHPFPNGLWFTKKWNRYYDERKRRKMMKKFEQI